MSLALSLLPIILLLVLLFKKNPTPAFYALPLSALLMFIIFTLYFHFPAIEGIAGMFQGYSIAITPISVVFFALFFSKVLEASGATNIIRGWLASITHNPIAQVMIVGWALMVMLEGASGFGAPGAIIAPFLIALGFNPVRTILFVLMVNSMAVSFGGVGVPSWLGITASNLDSHSLQIVASKTSIAFLIMAFVVPVLALRFLTSFNMIWKNIIFIYLSIIAVMIPYAIIAQLEPEITALLGGAIGLAITIILAKFGVGICKTCDWTHVRTSDSYDPEKFLNAEKRHPTHKEFHKAIFPIVFLIIFLIITHLDKIGIRHYLSLNDQYLFSPIQLYIFDFTITKSLGIVFHNILGTNHDFIYPTLLLPAIIPFGIIILLIMYMYKVPVKKTVTIGKAVFIAITKPWYALGSALGIVAMMSYGGDQSMFSIITNDIANSLGNYWLIIAFYIGTLGTFIAGSNTTSNLALSHFQVNVAGNLGLDQTTVLTLQNMGGAFGHMVSLSYIIGIRVVTGQTNVPVGYFLRRNILFVIFIGLLADIVVNLISIWGWYVH